MKYRNMATPPLHEINLSVINGSMLQATGCQDSILQMDGQSFLEQLDSLDHQMTQTLVQLGDELDAVIDKNTLDSLKQQPNRQIHFKFKTLIDFSEYSNKSLRVIIRSSNNKFYFSTLPKYFMCPLCLEPFQKPVTLDCSHVFCCLCLHTCSQLWSRMRCPACYRAFEQYPKINLLIERDLNIILKKTFSPLIGDFVLILSPYGSIPAFCIGVVSELVNGFVSRDMESVIIQDFGPGDLDQDHSSIKTTIAKVNIGGEIWIGKAIDLYVITPNYFPIATRPLRGSQVIHYKNVKVLQDPLIIGEVMQVNDEEINQTLNQSTCVNQSVNQNTKITENIEQKQDQQKSESSDIPSLLESGYLMPKALAEDLIPQYKFQEFVYDPIAPKQQQTFVSFVQVKKNEFFKLLKDEPVHKNVILMSSKQQLSKLDSTQPFLRICTDFQYVQRFPSFCCQGCKMLLRLPVLTLCNCNYCFNCIRQLYDLKLPCFGCGSRIDRPYNLSSLNKKLILKMYAKCPKHSPMVDSGLPVKIGDQYAVMIDDPNRINLWVLYGMGNLSYVYQNDVRALNLTALQTAIRATSGLVFYKKEFGFLENVDGQYYFSGRSNTNGQQIDINEVIYHMQKVIDDLREQIIVAKMDGAKVSQQKEQALIKMLKQKASQQYKKEQAELQKQHDVEMQKQAKSQKQLKPINQNHIYPGKTPKCQDDKQFQMERENRARRKKLHLVAPDNPNAAHHPGNQMLFDYGKDKTEKKDYVQFNTDTRLQQFMTKEALLDQRLRATKPYLIQLCYKMPYINFICSACWNVLKKPLILKCGHVVCRCCACIYQVNGGNCNQCYQSSGNVGELQMDIQLFEKLLETMDIDKYNYGFDIGSFVVKKGSAQVGLISQLNSTTADIIYPRELLQIEYHQLIGCDPVQETQDDMELGDVVKIIDGELLNIYGIIVGYPDQRIFAIRQIKKKYDLEDDSVVLKIQLETGVSDYLPVDILRKMQMGVVIADIESYQSKKKLAEKEREEEMYQEFLLEIYNGVIFEDEKPVVKQQQDEPVVRRNIWESDNAVQKGGVRK